MLLSIIFNAAITVLLISSIILGLKKADPPTKLFRYFTTLSNILCAVASLTLLIVNALAGAPLPLWAVVFKYVGTVAVTVTMLTVLCFLAPMSHQWKLLLTGIDMILHLIIPVLALVSFIFFEKTAMPAWTIALGVLPVVLYGMLYCGKVVIAPEQKRWEDFYGFNRGGRWKLSYLLMLIATAVIAFVLWVI